MTTGIVNRLPQQGQGTVAVAADSGARQQAAAAVSNSQTATTFAGLPASPTAGMRGFITNCNTAVFLATAAGGGANKVPVVYDGTNWLVG